MKDRKTIAGTMVVEITGAEPEKMLNALTLAGITVTDVTNPKDLVYRFTVPRKFQRELEKRVAAMGGKTVILLERGLYPLIRMLLQRPVLLCLAAALLISSFWLPTRILFLRVEGNEALPEKQILAAAERCGIGFGASRKQVRSEKMKNALLAQLPGLQWAGINTAGCTAVISVRERREEPEIDIPDFSNLVAARDGYILSQTVLEGTPLFAPGDSVMKGQVLISGYTDCGFCIRAGRAEGKILAQTSRDLDAVTPDNCLSIREITGRTRQISLLLRKKRINLWKDSRISDAGCGRMYEEYFVSLPGGFRLPVALCIDTCLEYALSETEIPEEAARARLRQFSDTYLLGQTVAGQIVSSRQQFHREKGLYRLESRYVCTEMIGREQKEEIGEINEQGN